MKLTEEQLNLLKKAYGCIEKVVNEIPLETEGVEAEMLWKAFMSLAIIVNKS